MKRSNWLYAALAVLLVATAGVTAQRAPAGEGERANRNRAHHRPRMERQCRLAQLEQLDLTLDQQKRILELRHELALEHLPLRHEMRELREEAGSLRQDPAANAKRLKQVAAGLAERRVELLAGRHRLQETIWDDVLTGEQRERAGSLERLLPDPGGRRGAGRGGPRPPAIPGRLGPNG